MRAILKTGTKILKSSNKIFVVGEPRSPILDLNPALITGVANGGAVAKIDDGSGNMNHALQANATYQGILRTNAINGLPAIEMDGVNDYYGLSNGANAKTLLMVYRNLDATRQSNMNPIISGESGYSADYFDTDQDTSKLFRNYPNLFAVSTMNRLWINGARIEPKLNALQQDYFRLITCDVAENIQLTLTRVAHRAVNPLGSYHWRGQIARMMIFDYRLTDIDRKNFEAQLLAEYAL